MVSVVGVKALLRDLARAGEPTGPIADALKAAGRAAATPVAATTEASLPYVTGTLSGDVRVTATRTGAAVRMGRSTIPYAGPVEFGGYPGDRPYLPQGRYLFPAAQRLAQTAAQTYSDYLQAAFDAMPWTNTTTDPGGVHD